MASLRKRSSRRPGGKSTWIIEFYPEPNRKREVSVAVGDAKRTENRAREFFGHFEELERAKKIGDSAELRTLQWCDKLDDVTRDKLVKVGLLAPRSKRRTDEQLQLGNFIQHYIDTDLESVAPNTRKNYGQMKNWLLKHFKADQDVRTLTPQDFKRWQKLMATGVESGPKKTQPLALATRNKHVQRVKTVFAAAVNDSILRESPAAILREEPSPKRVNRSREFFIDETLTLKILNGLPDTNWRLIFCLMRYQGFRRNEVFQLEWSHVDWENSRLTVNPEGRKKTEVRECPIFPETLPYLRDAFEQAESGSKVIRWAGSTESLTELFARQVKRINAGKAWPKILQQMRSVRRTELEERFPAHVCDEWLGHDNETAKRHYKQVTPAHWETASGSPVKQQSRGSAVAIRSAPKFRVGTNCRPIELKRSKREPLEATAKRRLTRLLPDCLTDSGVYPDQREIATDLEKRAKPLETAVVPGCADSDSSPPEYPVEDSNPCSRTESPMSWAARRTGRAGVANWKRRVA